MDYFDTGFTVRTAAWHNKSLVLAEAPETGAEARTLAGLDWEPKVVPMFQRKMVPAGVDQDGELVEVASYEEVPDGRLIVRDDTDAVIGRVGDGYTPVSNGTLFDMVEALTEQGGTYDTAGACKGGAVVWALVKLDEPYTLPGDDSQSYPFVSVVNYHDGSGSFLAQAGNVRIVCMNTVMASAMESERTGRFFKFRHTANVMDRVEEAKAALSGARQDAAEWQTLASQLIGLPVTTASYQAFLSEFIPEPVGLVVSDRVRQNIDTARATFTSCYNGVTNAAHHGTGLALVNASVEYLDHLRGYRNQDTYLGRTLLRPEPLKAKAVRLVREVCAL